MNQTKIDRLKALRKELAAIVAAPLGSAGDDYITADQRRRIEADLASIEATLEQIDEQDRAAFEATLPTPLNATQIYQTIVGLREFNTSEFDQIRDAIEAEPHLYLTSGQACRGWETVQELYWGSL
jgi:hypothetical protein